VPSTQPVTQPAGPTQQQIDAGQQLAQKKLERFAQFFYVISDDSFKKLRPDAKALFEPRPAPTTNLSALPGEKVDQKLTATTMPSGLQAIDLVEGNGAAAKEGDSVEVQYTGYLASDGTRFDSSLDTGKPFRFTLGKGEVIKGWDQGVAGMKVGGKRKLIVPSDLGYGTAGSPPRFLQMPRWFSILTC
jgi:peptidylprolyl isomerase